MAGSFNTRCGVTPPQAGVQSLWVLDSGFRRNDGQWRARGKTAIRWHGLAELGRGMTAVGWHGLAELGRGMTAMPAGVTGGSVDKKN
jgi:hypothetical protein